MGIYVWNDINYFEFYDSNNKYNKSKWTKLKYKSSTNFKNGDIFILSYNFNKNILIIYHNNIKAEIISLKNIKKIIPSFSLYLEDTQIQIIKYEFC